MGAGGFPEKGGHVIGKSSVDPAAGGEGIRDGPGMESSSSDPSGRYMG